MLNSPLIIDISFIVFLMILSLLGIRNGFISEFQKLLNLFISVLIANFITPYFIETFTYNYYVLFYIILLFTIFIIGFIIDTTIYNINIVKLDKRSDKLAGFFLGGVKGMLILMLIIYGSHLIPLQQTIKSNIHNKMKSSNIYSVCEKLNSIILKSNTVN